MSAPTRIALIGAGRIAHVHADAYLAIKDAQIVAVADPDAERAARLAARAGADAVNDYRELLSRSDIDAVDICTPTSTHEEIAVAALQAGKHVSCQKPFALDEASCDRIIAVAKQSGRILIVPYMSRHAPLPVKAKELIESGAIGEPINAHYHMLCPPGVALTRWFHEEDKSGGVLVDTLTHGVDLFNWYFGDVARVGAFIASSGGPDADVMTRDDNVAMIAHYKRGTVASLRVSWTAAQTFPMVLMDVLGTKGAIRLDTPSYAVSYQRLTLFGQDGTQEWESSGRGHHEKQQYFVDVVRGNVPLVLSNPDAARQAVRVTVAAWQAGRQNRIIEL